MKFLASQATSILRTRLRNQEYKCNSPIHFKTLLQSMHMHPSVKRKSHFFLEHGFRWRLIFYVLYRWCIELYTVLQGAVRRHPTVKTRCNFIDFQHKHPLLLYGSQEVLLPLHLNICSLWLPPPSLSLFLNATFGADSILPKREKLAPTEELITKWLPYNATVKPTWKQSGFAWSLTFWN